MIVRCQPDYVTADKAKAMSPGDYALLREISDAPADQGDVKYGVTTCDLVDLETHGPIFERLGLTVSIKKFPGQTKVVVPGVGDDIQHVHVHVANIGLLEVDEVMNIDDACTDALRDRLEDGWRILCVCPPNNQLRPDYILGRSARDRKYPR